MVLLLPSNGLAGRVPALAAGVRAEDARAVIEIELPGTEGAAAPRRLVEVSQVLHGSDERRRVESGPGGARRRHEGEHRVAGLEDRAERVALLHAVGRLRL